MLNELAFPGEGRLLDVGCGTGWFARQLAALPNLQITGVDLDDGEWRLVPARELVPGDQIHIGPGDLVPADCAVDEGTVEADQSMLTGESAVVTRSVGEVVYSASTIRGGQATATVTATAAKSYFGRTAELVRSARAAGHLDQPLFAVVRHLVTIDTVLAAGMGENRKVLNQIADTAREACFSEVVQGLAERLKEQGVDPKQAYPCLEGHQQDEQGTWRRVSWPWRIQSRG